MIDVIKQWVPLWVKQRIRAVVDREDLDLPHGARAFLFLAADYGNIGDIAITAAQERFLAQHAGRPHVVVVPISKTRARLRSIQLQIAPGDLVATVGGGNMGVAYPDIETLRQLVIRSFPENRVVCFPQTLDWDATPASDRSLRTLVEVYAGHADLHVFARESVSQARLQELFASAPGVRVGLVPDIVLSATAADLGASPAETRQGVLLCMRDDQERAVSDTQRHEIDASLARLGMPIEVTDTHAGGARLSADRCRTLLRDKVEQFAAARLAVTDRLHGMILSLVAGTPCLVLPNSNHKIHQTHQDWLRGNPRVEVLSLDRLDSVDGAIARLLAADWPTSGVPPLGADAYAPLRTALSAP